MMHKKTNTKIHERGKRLLYPYSLSGMPFIYFVPLKYRGKINCIKAQLLPVPLTFWPPSSRKNDRRQSTGDFLAVFGCCIHTATSQVKDYTATAPHFLQDQHDTAGMKLSVDN
jgi:hypothetical protein